jgi:integrase
MRRACRDAKIPNYTPHDLRHWRLTIMPVDEIAEERFAALLA